MTVSVPVPYGKYQLLHKLGRGGMAEVWLAEQQVGGEHQVTLVIKRILPQLAEDPQFLALFLAEARLLRRLNHPNIVRVVEVGQHGDEHFLAMEYVHGRDLVSVMQAAVMASLSTPELGIYVVREVARALAYVHSLTDESGRPLGIVHRDISPSNIMVSFDGSVKLLDFGVAKARGDTSGSHELSTAGSLKGKFSYMAPEQTTGASTDHRVDIFAIGVVLWEMLTGRRLFKADSIEATLALVREAQIVPPSQLTASVEPRLDAIVLHATARDPAARYATAEQLAQDLDPLVAEYRWGPERMADLMMQLFASRYLSRPRATRGEQTHSAILGSTYLYTPVPDESDNAQRPTRERDLVLQADFSATAKSNRHAVELSDTPVAGHDDALPGQRSEADT